MSYDFNYDTTSGLTPWPMIWTITPTEYNWSGTLGDKLSFTVRAVPDPNYPQAWNEFYAPPEGTTGGVPSLPPQPVIQEYIYSIDSTIDEEFVTLTTEFGLVLDELDTELFFPYEDITYYKNFVKKNATFPQEVIDDDFDYVSSFVPDRRPSIVRNSIVTAVSTSKSDLLGNFRYFIQNDWNRARLTLLNLAETSKDFFEDLVSDSVGTEIGEPNPNSGIVGELPPSKPPTSTTQPSIKDKFESSYDDFFRNADDDRIQEVFSTSNDFLNTITNDTLVDIPVSTEEFATSESPVDALIRDGNFEELITKHGFTMEQIIEILRGLK